MTNNATDAAKLGRLSGFATVLSIVACYGTLAFVSILSLMGITVNIHEGVWAGAITLFAWLAFAGVAINFRRYHALGPLIIAAAGAVLITWVMFISFSRPLEILGFVLLITAALWERRVKRCVQKAEAH
jgi:hypothetical protein